jgi:hypothetical protein
MRRWLLLTAGTLAVVVGAVWTLQGLGHLGGSAMTGDRLWAVVGPVVVLAGVATAGLGWRARPGDAGPDADG